MFRMNSTPRAQGEGESGDRSKGHDLLLSADYADYADYCMRLAWAMRRSGAFQVCPLFGAGKRKNDSQIRSVPPNSKWWVYRKAR